MIGRLTSMFGRLMGNAGAFPGTPPGGSGVAASPLSNVQMGNPAVNQGAGPSVGLMPVLTQPQLPKTAGEWRERIMSIYGPPRPPRPTQDNIWSTIWVQPYQGPLDVDPYNAETAAMRMEYRVQTRTNPIARAAIMGKINDVTCLDVTVLPADKDNRESNLAAEFVKWTVTQAPRGWRGVLEAIYAPAVVDGFSLTEKKLKPVRWKGRQMWGLAQLRSLDTANLRLELDQFRNVVAVVNLLRGLEYYSPDQVILYSHNSMYSNPFGTSDMRAATRAANLIEDTYKVWYLALQVYGLPYMVGKSAAQNRQIMGEALAALREGGYMVCDKEEDVEVLNLASAAGSTGFNEMIRTQREDIFYAVRGAALPFLEGQGGTGAHGDTDIQKGTSDAGERASALDLESAINEQLIPWLVYPNFGDIDMPRIKLGGTNWELTKTVVSLVKESKELGTDVSAEWFHEVASIPPPRDEADVLGKSTDDEPRDAELVGSLQGLSGLMNLQQAFYGGQIPQAAAVASLVTVFKLDEATALKLLPPVDAKKRTDDGQDAGGGLAAMLGGGGGAPPDGGGAEPAMFSAPGPPPRPGLVWKEETHRWVRGSDHDGSDNAGHPAAAEVSRLLDDHNSALARHNAERDAAFRDRDSPDPELRRRSGEFFMSRRRSPQVDAAAVGKAFESIPGGIEHPDGSVYKRSGDQWFVSRPGGSIGRVSAGDVSRAFRYAIPESEGDEPGNSGLAEIHGAMPGTADELASAVAVPVLESGFDLDAFAEVEAAVREAGGRIAVFDSGEEDSHLYYVATPPPGASHKDFAKLVAKTVKLAHVDAPEGVGRPTKLASDRVAAGQLFDSLPGFGVVVGKDRTKRAKLLNNGVALVSDSSGDAKVVPVAKLPPEVRARLGGGSESQVFSADVGPSDEQVARVVDQLLGELAGVHHE